MELRELYFVLNIVFAFLAIPPAVYLIGALIKERYLIKTGQKLLNDTLSFLFAGLSIGALINASLAFMSLAGNGNISHGLSPIRSVYINVFFTIVSWLLFYVKKTNETK